MRLYHIRFADDIALIINDTSEMNEMLKQLMKALAYYLRINYYNNFYELKNNTIYKNPKN